MPVEHFCKKVPLPTLGCWAVSSWNYWQAAVETTFKQHFKTVFRC
jgi:hypothetical protein